ncbi:uncharacterized protein LOC129218461 [Uloborus diversus]|uniref:uncharacterized protein LOC129218461 n=1 Tax=Uloborus diversus TaxID=327109 RepID=UPI0024094513|nr:uncharacterized protein LOC129218461 [Uloborus diversus]
MVLKLSSLPMEQDFDLNSIIESPKRELDHPLPNSIPCCQDPRYAEEQINQQRSDRNQPVTTTEQQIQHQLQFQGVEMLGSVPSRRAVVFTGNGTGGFSPDCQGFSPSPPSGLAAVPTDIHPVMQQSGRTSHLLDESMQMWLSGAQPIDLSSEMENWLMRRNGAYGDVLTTVEDNAIQQQQQSKLSGYCVETGPPSSSSGFFSASDDGDSMEDIPCRSGRNEKQQSMNPDQLLDESSLISLSVRDLNRRLHGYPRDVIQRIKQKRRTLKNRGYAQNCRTKRIALKCELERTNRWLKTELERILQQKEVERQEKERAYQERDYYKQQLKQQLSMSSNRDCSGSLSSGLSSNNASSPSSPEFYL